jgi:hypothetical protein
VPIISSKGGLSSGGYGQFAYAANLAPTNSYFPIASYTVPSGNVVGTMTLANIPQTYSHLQIRMLTLTSQQGSGMYMYFNGDTTNANYRSHGIAGDGSTATAYTYAIPFQPWTAGGAGATAPGSAIIDILDYRDTNKNKVSRGISGYDANGTGLIFPGSALWPYTSAITSIQFGNPGTTYYAGTNISIYGVN